ncbi:NADH dehydrogenase [Sanguibacter gelidistatuariae]|uniref:NADH:ubiquinone reductase (non-electrogenic) n=1 Tax=Sanguibacter gelidistatuariae TaxID=1814289 RepID=A0A1G6WX98_9MICO|nr:NAD(P)/FAD-dependent oxidoreductase [Sanguibacter gelidistatuariae]SDD69807.1 NADH dehydrogenase [Sanguibacter gelidistatuariae]
MESPVVGPVKPATPGGTTPLPHVVVIGGGFAGVAAVKALAGAPVKITLVDRRVYKTFQPLLYQVATGGLNAGDVTYFLRSLRLRQKNLRVVHEHLVGINTETKTIRLLDDVEIGYDYLVLANGVTTNYFGTPGAKEHAFAVYSRSQALAIRDTLFVRLEHAAASPGTHDGLHIVVVGGGATGVEIAGALAELRDQGLRPAYPEIRGDAFNVSIVQRGGEVLKAFPVSLRVYAAKQLAKRNVDLHLGAGVASVLPDAVKLTDGTRIRSDLTIWATGVAPHPEVGEWNLPIGAHGRVTTGPDLQVEGLPGVFAAGDIAATPFDLPQLAQPAIQGGRHAGKQIRNLLAGRPTTPLRYIDKGTLAVIGRSAAVGDIAGKIRLRGKVAWWVWLFVHIAGLLGSRNRFTTIAGLLSRYSIGFHRRPVPIVGDVPSIRPPKRGAPRGQDRPPAAE